MIKQFIFFLFQMTVGSIVHELFQIVLRRKLTTLEQIKAVSDEMLTDGGMAYTLYASSMNSSEARTEFDSFLNRIYDFMQQYIEGKSPPKSDKNTVLINRLQYSPFKSMNFEFISFLIVCHLISDWFNFRLKTSSEPSKV